MVPIEIKLDRIGERLQRLPPESRSEIAAVSKIDFAVVPRGFVIRRQPSVGKTRHYLYYRKPGTQKMDYVGPMDLVAKYYARKRSLPPENPAQTSLNLPTK